jgi:opacity protein-like surface antigen
MRRAPTLLLLGLGVQHAYAQDNAYGYLGAFAGSFDYEEDLSEIAPGASFSDSATAVKVYGGYRFNEWFTVEGSFGVTDTLGESATLPSIIGPIPAQLGADFEFLTVNALGHIAFDKLTLLGGIGYWDADITVEIDATVPGFGQVSFEDSESDSGTMYSAGVQWDFDSLALRVQYDLFDIDDADASMIGIGVHWVFGR